LNNNKEALSLLKDTECWLNEIEEGAKAGDLHLTATLPSLAGFLQKLTNPEALQAFQTMLREINILHNDNITLKGEITSLNGEISDLKKQVKELCTLYHFISIQA